MATIFDHIKRIRTVYENWGVREDMAKALEILMSKITGLVHNSGASNLIEYPAGAAELNGITYVLTDEGIYVSGTATAASWLALDWGEKKQAASKKYVAKLNKTGTGTVYLSVGYFMDEGQTSYATIGSTEGSLSYTMPSQYVSSRDMIYVPAGTTVDAVVNPSIRLANEDEPTEPQIYTVEEISEKIHSGSIGGGKGVKKADLASKMIDPDLIYLYTGSEPNYSNGYWYYHNGTAFVRGAQFYLGLDGNDGADGSDGLTPYIGQNGNWFIGNTDTGVVARASTEDSEARESIADLQTTVATIQQAIAGISSQWETVLDKTMNGIHWVISVNQFTHEFFIDAGGTWSGSPNTSGTEFQVSNGAITELAYDESLNDYVMYAAYSNNQQGRVHIKPDGSVWFGWCVNIASASQLKASGNCRIKMVGVLR